MTTLEQYFDDQAVPGNMAYAFTTVIYFEKASFSIKAMILLDVISKSKWLSFYLPRSEHLGNCILALLASQGVKDGTLATHDFGVQIGRGSPDLPDIKSSNLADILADNGVGENVMYSTALFTKTITLYLDCKLTLQNRKTIVDAAQKQGLTVTLYDNAYAEMRSEAEVPLGFISHDHRDKDDLVRDLAQQLSVLKCPVWYDEYSLNVGDNLRASIEKGLTQARKCVIILSPNFFSNTGWGKVEFNSIFMREIIEAKDVILPVWHNVGKAEVYNYCPSLIGKVGLQSTVGIPKLAAELSKAIRK